MDDPNCVFYNSEIKILSTFLINKVNKSYFTVKVLLYMYTLTSDFPNPYVWRYMIENHLNRREFMKEAMISEKILSQWETAKIIKPEGYTGDNLPFYSTETLEQIKDIKKFLGIGYTPEEIYLIMNKIGFPKNNETQKKSIEFKKRLTVGTLARQVGVSARTIKHWEEKGIIESDMRSEGGFRLYSGVFVYLCELIKDLQLFGYSLEEIKITSDFFREFLEIEGKIETYSREETEKKLNIMLHAIQQLTNKMNLLKEGISHWEKLVNKKKREISILKKTNYKREISSKDE